MALSNDNLAGGAANVFREAVCIDTRRIYDACSEEDCQCYINIQRGRESFSFFTIFQSALRAACGMPRLQVVLPDINQIPAITLAAPDQRCIYAPVCGIKCDETAVSFALDICRRPSRFFFPGG